MHPLISDIVEILVEGDTEIRRERAAYVARLRDRMKLPWKRIGRQLNVSRQRAGQLYNLHRLFQEDFDEPEVDPKEFSSQTDPSAAMQKLAKALADRGLRGEFKFWPKGAYKGPWSEFTDDADFTLTISDALADRWGDRHEKAIGLIAHSLGYEFQRNTPHSIHFYYDPRLLSQF